MIENKVIGKVTEEEKNEILVIYERKLGIEELVSSLASDLLSSEQKESMQEKMIQELGKNKINMQAWWDKMYKKYQWEKVEGHYWHIDFETCEIFLD